MSSNWAIMVKWARKRCFNHGLTDGLTEKAKPKNHVIPILFPILLSRSTVWRPHVALPSSPRDNLFLLRTFKTRKPFGFRVFPFIPAAGLCGRSPPHWWAPAVPGRMWPCGRYHTSLRALEKHPRKVPEAVCETPPLRDILPDRQTRYSLCSESMLSVPCFS